MDNNLIYDVGMHNGDDTAYYLHKGYRVLGIEANPILAQACRDRFAAAIAGGRLEILAIGINTQPGVRQFWVCDDCTVLSSFDRDLAARQGYAHHAVAVPCRSFRDILDQFGVPFYLKVDIEGSDMLCLDALNSDDLPAYISVELSDLRQFPLLQQLGYSNFKCVRQNDFRVLRSDSAFLVREKAFSFLRPLLLRAPWALNFARSTKHRLNVLRCSAAAKHSTDGGGAEKWIFPRGSSGPFGPELPGPWQSLETAALAWLAAQAGYSRYGRPSFAVWYDLHVARQI